MKSSCIRHPERNPFIQLYDWQIKFCVNNHCAALILSVFIGWHDWKLVNDQYYQHANDIAEMHGDGRPHNQHAYLFFTTENLIAYTMGFYGKKAIQDALELLASLKVISIHPNPNPRYCFDKTKYFLFYPNVCNQWIAHHYPIDKNQENSSQVIDSFDNVKIADREDQNRRPAGKNGRPSDKSSQAITYTTNNTTNKKDQLINTRNHFVEQNTKQDISQCIRSIKQHPTLQTIFYALIERGFPAERFSYPDVVSSMEGLLSQGATLEHFIEAHDIALQVCKQRSFGVRYLLKIVEDLLSKSKRRAFTRSTPAPLSLGQPDYTKMNYESDYTNGLNWMNTL